MNKELEKKIMNESYVDTKRYRYMKIEGPFFIEIVRLPIKCLGTVKAYQPWETVKFWVR